MDANKLFRDTKERLSACIPGNDGCLPGKKTRMKRACEIALGIGIWALIAWGVMAFRAWVLGN